jgi:NAD(P)-dependent dehydrogenase (short-subunit alcohol dehydrogenase family)
VIDGLDPASVTVVVIGRPEAPALELARRLLRLGTQRFGFVGDDPAAGAEAAELIRRSASGIWSLHVVADPADPADLARGVEELAASIGDPELLIADASAADAAHALAAGLPGDGPIRVVVAGEAD